jgi:hypothetical protein
MVLKAMLEISVRGATFIFGDHRVRVWNRENKREEKGVSVGEQ